MLLFTFVADALMLNAFRRSFCQIQFLTGLGLVRWFSKARRVGYDGLINQNGIVLTDQSSYDWILLFRCLLQFSGMAYLIIVAVIINRLVLFLHLFLRNILTLTNAFSIGDENITLQNYDEWLSHLNSSDPSEVASLNLKTCDLQTYLEQVHYTNIRSPSGFGVSKCTFVSEQQGFRSSMRREGWASHKGWHSGVISDTTKDVQVQT